MMYDRSYKIAFGGALVLHFALVFLLFYSPDNPRPVLTVSRDTAPYENLTPKDATMQPIKATSVDSAEVMAAMEKIQAERNAAKVQEANRQKQLALQAEALRKQRLQEQEKVAKLKAEAKRLADERQKQALLAEKKLKALKEQQEAEAKRVATLKKQQQELAAQAQKKAEAEKKAAAEQKQREQELAQKKAQEERLAAERRAQIAGVVDKYKALIINAISREWIVPENAAHDAACQFRIRLAPNGTVLEVSITQSSGDPVLDRSAQAAIFKASPLPVPAEADAFNVFRDIRLTVRPESFRG